MFDRETTIERKQILKLYLIDDENCQGTQHIKRCSEYK